MIYAFGDSHINFYIRNINLHIENLHENSITMHRVGRDNKIIKFNSSFNGENNIFLLCYGEVDCRCHINKQVETGRSKNEVCETLVKNYIDTIKNNIISYKKIILFFIPPAVNKEEFVKYNGEYTPAHGYPIIGTDNERVDNVKIMNTLLKTECLKNGFEFIDCSEFYSNENGTIRTEYWDTTCHIKDNTEIHNKLYDILLKD
jgi:hypothetical protein